MDIFYYFVQLLAPAVKVVMLLSYPSLLSYNCKLAQDSDLVFTSQYLCSCV